jgi:trans-aconitate 2-methyltransferase
MTWDPATYLAFADERGRPFLDLLARVDADPATVVDLGCGPGQLSPVLRARWPRAQVLGVDSSAEMIDRARADDADPRTRYERADVATWAPDGAVDVVVSNALFQWVPEPLAVVERLAGHVRPGGTFALQVPGNFDAPSHRLLHETAAREPYAPHTRGLDEARGTELGSWHELFAGLGWSVDAWETTYLHVLPGEDPVFDWIRGTGARPVLQALPDDLRAGFEREYKAALREAYPRRPWGTVLPFRRLFCVARRPDEVR